MADGSVFSDKKSNGKKPRIAYAGEEYGFGFRAVDNLLRDARNVGIADAGFSAVKGKRIEREFTNVNQSIKKASKEVFDFSHANRQPLRTKEQAILAVYSKTADYAVVPFYSPYTGYDFETIRALTNFNGLRAVEQVEAGDHLCLAVHESQVLELTQSSHPGSTLSSLISRERKFWGGEDQRIDSINSEFVQPGRNLQAGWLPSASLQMMLRDRLDGIFVRVDLAPRCKSKLDGMRGAGVEVKSLPDTIEPHRDFARMARQTLNGDRVVNTYFNPKEGDAHYVSAMNGSAQNAPFYGVVLPFEVAMRSEEYIIIDENIEDDDPVKHRFMVIKSDHDHSLHDDAWRTTDAKTRYWEGRLRAVAGSASGDNGVRVLFKFRRDGTAASIGDVENYLRNYGVRHSVVRTDEDSERGAPAPIVLDVEFDIEDFDYSIARRLRGTVANGAIKKAFQRWKDRGVTIMGAMPYDHPQLPAHKKRRWWFEAVGAWFKDVTETMFVRLSRFLFYIVTPLMIAVFVYLLWHYMQGQ